MDGDYGESDVKEIQRLQVQERLERVLGILFLVEAWGLSRVAVVWA